MKRYISLLLSAVLIVGTLVGCSGNANKKWIIVTDTVFKPFEYTDADNNFVGIDVELLQAIAEDQGFDYELKSVGWDAAIAECRSGRADGMLAGASITDARQEDGWIFSDGYFDATQCMAVGSDSDIAAFDDLVNCQVAVKSGTRGADYANNLRYTYDFEIIAFEDSPEMYQAVINGKVAACFEDTPIMLSSINDDSLDMKVVEGSENEGSAYGFAIFSEDDRELLDMFNAGLRNIKANGKYDEIIKKYIG